LRSRFSPDRITVVREAKLVIVSLTLVDLKTNQAFDRPVGTTGSRDQDSHAAIEHSGELSLDGSWRNTNGDAIMPIDHSGDRTSLHWILLDNPNDPGLSSFPKGPRPEVCTTPTGSLRLGGTARLSCTNRDGSTVGIGLQVIDRDHVKVGSDGYFFIPLSGTYVRCPSADACR
jgi:hypothetical protein